MELLKLVQKTLKAPKNQHNKFGGYNYRSCEDILEAVKPIIADKGALILEDQIVQVGDRYYVKATATLYEGDRRYSTSAFAREPIDKKGSDASQITGASSSYARKYALNGLFLIDDTKDADATNQHGKEDKKDGNSTKYVNEILSKTSRDQLVGWLHDNQKAVDALPEEDREIVLDQYEMRLEGVEAGKMSPGPFKWSGVAQMDSWCVGAKADIERCSTLEELAQWEEGCDPDGIGRKVKLAALEAKRKTRMREIMQQHMKKIEETRKDVESYGA